LVEKRGGRNPHRHKKVQIKKGLQKGPIRKKGGRSKKRVLEACQSRTEKRGVNTQKKREKKYLRFQKGPCAKNYWREKKRGEALKKIGKKGEKGTN